MPRVLTLAPSHPVLRQLRFHRLVLVRALDRIFADRLHFLLGEQSAKLAMPLSFSAPSWTICSHAAGFSSAPERRRSGSTVDPTAPGAWHTAQ